MSKLINKFIKAIGENDINKVKELIKTVNPGKYGKYFYEDYVSETYPIILAVEKNNQEIINLLLNDPRVDPGVDENAALQKAIQNNNLEIVNLLLNDQRVHPMCLIIYAVMNNQIEIVKRLLEDSRVDPSCNDNRSLNLAAQKGHIDIVNLLLDDERLRPDNKALEIASYEHRVDVVNRLLKDPRFDPTLNNYAAIEKAAEKENTKVVSILLNDERVDWNKLIDYDFFSNAVTVEDLNRKRFFGEKVTKFVNDVIKLKKEINLKRIRMFNNISNRYDLNSDLNKKIFEFIERFGKSKKSKRNSKSKKSKSKKSKRISKKKRISK